MFLRVSFGIVLIFISLGLFNIVLYANMGNRRYMLAKKGEELLVKTITQRIFRHLPFCTFLGIRLILILIVTFAKEYIFTKETNVDYLI